MLRLPNFTYLFTPLTNQIKIESTLKIRIKKQWPPTFFQFKKECEQKCNIIQQAGKDTLKATKGKDD